MYTKQSIQSLESDLAEYGKHLYAEDCTQDEYDKAVAIINAKIGYKKLVLAKQRAGRLADTLKLKGVITRIEYNLFIRSVYIAESEEEAIGIIETMNNLQPNFQNKAA